MTRPTHGRSRDPRRTVPKLPPPRTARQLALSVLHEYRRHPAFITDILENQLTRHPQADAERRLATELAYGIVRRQSTLDAMIEPHVQRPRKQVEPLIWTLLQLGTYQLVFLDAIPQHAALNETVELTRWAKRPGAAKFVNGILRSISRLRTDDEVDAPGPAALPRGEGRFLRLAAEIFADPQTDPKRYLARATSFPGWIVGRWCDRFGFDDTLAITDWLNRSPNITLRANPLRIERDQLLAKLTAAGLSAAPGHHPQAIHLDNAGRVSELPGFTEGEFAVQDETAMQAATRLAPAPGQRVLDLCAAPGTKTTHLAELMNDTGEIIACDVNSERLKLVEQGAGRLGISVIKTQLVRSTGDNTPDGPFDALLLDVPCSNTGVLGKRPDARWRITPDDLIELPAIQAGLLDRAAKRAAHNARMLYSTCSIEPEENREVVERFLKQHSDWTLVEDATYLPGRPADGGYQALLVRSC